MRYDEVEMKTSLEFPILFLSKHPLRSSKNIRVEVE